MGGNREVIKVNVKYVPYLYLPRNFYLLLFGILVTVDNLLGDILPEDYFPQRKSPRLNPPWVS